MIPQISEELKAKIIAASTWLTIKDMSNILKLDTDQVHDLLNSWEQEGQVFSVEYQGVQLIPEYAVNPEGKPLPALKKILTVFNGKKSCWATAAWFASVNGWLGGITPMEVMRSRPEALIQAAKEESRPSEHG